MVKTKGMLSNTISSGKQNNPIEQWIISTEIENALVRKVGMVTS